jgi:hypothetical protein
MSRRDAAACERPCAPPDPAGFSHDQLSGSLTPHGMGPVLKKEAWSPEASPPLPPPPVRSPPDGVLSPESVEGWSPAIKSVVAPHVLGSVVAPEAPALPEGLPQPAPPGHPGAPAGRGAAPAQRSLEQIRAGADGQHPSAPAARGGPPGPPGPWPNWRPVMCLALFRCRPRPAALRPAVLPRHSPLRACAQLPRRERALPLQAASAAVAAASPIATAAAAAAAAAADAAAAAAAAGRARAELAQFAIVAGRALRWPGRRAAAAAAPWRPGARGARHARGAARARGARPRAEPHADDAAPLDADGDG